MRWRLLSEEKGGLATPVFAKTDQWEKELDRFRQEIGKLKEDLRTQPVGFGAVGEDGYKTATQIDLTVNRFLRLWDKYHDNNEKQQCS